MDSFLKLICIAPRMPSAFAAVSLSLAFLSADIAAGEQLLQSPQNPKYLRRHAGDADFKYAVKLKGGRRSGYVPPPIYLSEPVSLKSSKKALPSRNQSWRNTGTRTSRSSTSITATPSAASAMPTSSS